VRALFSIFCLFSNLSGRGIAEELEAAQQERTEQYHTVLAEIAPDKSFSVTPLPHDLPDGIREAIEAWTEAKA
jgi:hypothetical protein